MAGNHTGFGGFEIGDRSYYTASNGNARLVYDHRNARSGDCYLLMNEPGSALLSRVSLEQPTTGLGPTADGEIVQGKFRVWMYIEQIPGTADYPILSLGYNNVVGYAGSVLRTDGTFACQRYNAVTGAASTAVLVIGRYYRCDLTVTWTNVVASSNTRYDISFSVYEADGTLVETVTIVNGTESHTIPDGTIRSLCIPTLGGAGASTKRIRFDDFWHSIHGPGSTPAFPANDARCTIVKPTGQGASAAWTGDYRNVRQIPRIELDVTAEQTTTGVGNATTFTHQSAAALGLSGIEGVRVWGRMKRTGGTNVNHALLWDGVQYPMLVNNTTYAASLIAGYGYGPALSTAAFDAAEFGAQTLNGDSIQLGVSLLEVLHSGDGPPDSDLYGAASVRLKIVQYTGNGTLREITGVGFKSSVILVKKGNAGGNHAGIVWMAGTGTVCKELDVNTFRSFKLLGATADGFEVSDDADINETGSSFVAICLQDGGQHASGFLLKAGLYVPSGIDGWDEPIGMQPDFLMTHGFTASILRTTDNAGDESFHMTGSATVAGFIQALNADGFEASNGSELGAAVSSEFIPYVALRNPSGLLDAFFAYGRVTGAGSTGTITGVPFAPYFAYAGKLGSTATRPFRAIDFPDHTGTISSAWSTGTTIAANGIASMTADGFTGGSDVFQAAVETQWFAFAEEGEIPLAPPEIEFEPDQDGTTIGIHWVHFYDKALTEHVWSKVPLPDPITYYGGWKEARVLRWGTIRRALSDWRGEYESTTFGWVLADTDRVIRGLAANLTTRWLKGRNVIIRTITDAARRLLETPRTVVRGITTRAKPLSPLHYEISAEDWFVSLFRVGNNEQQIPKRVGSRTINANAPNDLIDRAIPILYGELSDEGSATAPPVLSGDPARGAFTSGGFWANGWGDLPSTADPPSAVTPAAIPGGSVSADVPGATYGIIATSVDGSGVESDPTPFFYDQPGATFPGGVPTVVVDGTEQVQVTFTPGAGASFTRVYLCYYYFGTRFVQYLQTAGSSVTFDTSPAFAGVIDATTIATGASVILFGNIHYYVISAVMADGETGQTAEVQAVVRGFRRPVRIQWLAVPSALGYRIYRRGSVPGSFDHQWAVTAVDLHFDDDLLETSHTTIDHLPAASGVVPVIYAGIRLDASGFPWHSFLICGHAITEIIAWYSGGVRVHPGTAGVDWAVPGHPNYSVYFPNTGATQYLDENGERCTYIFARGPYGDDGASGVRPITLNVRGIETLGDSSGTLITSGPQIYKHALKNWLVGDYRSGDWLDSPTFEDDSTLPKIDEDSFDVAELVMTDRIAGGYPHAVIMGANGERVSIRVWIARFNLNNDVNSRFNRKTQFGIVAESDAVALLDAARHVTQVRDIFEKTFDVEDQDDRHFNIAPYAFAYNYRTNRFDSEDAVSDAESIESYGVELEDQRVDFYLVRLAIVAHDIAARRLARTKDPPRLVSFTTGLQGLNVELGDVILVTHVDGIGANGYARQPLRVIRHEFDPDQYTVRLEAYDAGYLFAGAFILGDESTLPADWDDADATERRYGYLADEVTETFTNGDPIKRLR